LQLLMPSSVSLSPEGATGDRSIGESLGAATISAASASSQKRGSRFGLYGTVSPSSTQTTIDRHSMAPPSGELKMAEVSKLLFDDLSGGLAGTGYLLSILETHKSAEAVKLTNAVHVESDTLNGKCSHKPLRAREAKVRQICDRLHHTGLAGRRMGRAQEPFLGKQSSPIVRQFSPRRPNGEREFQGYDIVDQESACGKWRKNHDAMNSKKIPQSTGNAMMTGSTPVQKKSEGEAAHERLYRDHFDRQRRSQRGEDAERQSFKKNTTFKPDLRKSQQSGVSILDVSGSHGAPVDSGDQKRSSMMLRVLTRLGGKQQRTAPEHSDKVVSAMIGHLGQIAESAPSPKPACNTVDSDEHNTVKVVPSVSPSSIIHERSYVAANDEYVVKRRWSSTDRTTSISCATISGDHSVSSSSTAVPIDSSAVRFTSAPEFLPSTSGTDDSPPIGGSPSDVPMLAPSLRVTAGAIAANYPMQAPPVPRIWRGVAELNRLTGNADPARPLVALPPSSSAASASASLAAIIAAHLQQPPSLHYVGLPTDPENSGTFSQPSVPAPACLSHSGRTSSAVVQAASPRTLSPTLFPIGTRGTQALNAHPPNALSPRSRLSTHVLEATLRRGS